MQVFISLADKRHITLRSTLLPNGASCKHYKDEDEANQEASDIIKAYVEEGFTVKEFTKGEWVATKEG